MAWKILGWNPYCWWLNPYIWLLKNLVKAAVNPTKSPIYPWVMHMISLYILLYKSHINWLSNEYTAIYWWITGQLKCPINPYINPTVFLVFPWIFPWISWYEIPLIPWDESWQIQPNDLTPGLAQGAELLICSDLCGLRDAFALLLRGERRWFVKRGSFQWECREKLRLENRDVISRYDNIYIYHSVIICLTSRF